MEGGAHQDQTNRQHATQQSRQYHDQRLLRLDSAGFNGGIIDDPHIADSARLHDIELLLLIEQLDEDLLTHLYITGQTQNLLLGFWQTLDRLVDGIFGIHQGLALFHQGDVSGVLAGIKLLQLSFPEGQLVELLLEAHHGIQCGLGFQRQIDRLILLTIHIQQLFRTVQLIFDLGQMDLQEIQALLGLFGLAHHILLQIVLADVVEHRANAALVFPFQRQRDDPGIFALLADLKITLQLGDHIQSRLFDQREDLPLIGSHIRQQQGDILFLKQLAYLAFQHSPLNLEGKVCVVINSQR
ncbi:hypothetical protein D3C84_634610 [compost metagenome]